MAALPLAASLALIEASLRLADYRLSAVLHAPDGELPQRLGRRILELEARR